MNYSALWLFSAAIDVRDGTRRKEKLVEESSQSREAKLKCIRTRESLMEAIAIAKVYEEILNWKKFGIC